jgi:hypothetical protein
MGFVPSVNELVERGLATIASPVYSHMVNGSPVCNARVVRTAFTVMSLALAVIFSAVCGAIAVARGTVPIWLLCGAAVSCAAALALGVLDFLWVPKDGFGPGSARYTFPPNLTGAQGSIEIIVPRELPIELPEGVTRQRL